jgi:hypothetical protein
VDAVGRETGLPAVGPRLSPRAGCRSPEQGDRLRSGVDGRSHRALSRRCKAQSALVCLHPPAIGKGLAGAAYGCFHCERSEAIATK